MGKHDAIKSCNAVSVGVSCGWLPGLTWVHWADLDLALALSCHVVVYVCVGV